MKENETPLTRPAISMSGESGKIQTSTTSVLAFSNAWSTPERIEVSECDDHIEMIYKQTFNFQLAIYPPIPSEERVFKIIFSCIDGKWNKSEPIYGKIIPAQNEYYEFE